MKKLIATYFLAAWTSSSLNAHSDKGHIHTHNDSTVIPEFVINPQSESNPWTHLALNNDPQSFQFAIVTDNTGGMRPGVFSDAVNKLNLLQPEFVMSVGDLINGYTENESQLVAEWDEFDDMVQDLQMPFFYVAGNHDYTNDVMAQVWEERYGASYYHFVYRDTLFIMMNSNDGGQIHTMSQKQVSWLKGVLEDSPDPRWTLVFVHSPLWDSSDSSLWPEVDALLEGRKYTVFAGHHHRYVKRQRQGRNYFTLATTGGGSNLRGPRFGEFDHVMWVTMSDEGPILANLMLEGIWSEDIRDEELRDRQAAVIDGGKLSMRPILYRDHPDKGLSELRLTNDTNVPYRIELDFRQIANVSLLSDRTADITVPPNEVVQLPIEIGYTEPVPDQFEALSMDWTLTFMGEKQKESFTGVERLSVVKELPIPTIATVKADARFTDWKDVPFMSDNGYPTYRPENWKNEADASFEWAIATSAGALNIAIKVNDETLVRNPGRDAWYQDCILLQIDARPTESRLRNRSGIKNERQALRIGLLPPVEGIDSDLSLRSATLEKSAYSYKIETIDGGYVAELSIPFAELDTAAKGAWEQIRVNVFQIDWDPDEGSRAIRQWQDAWSNPQTLLGSGSFYRQ